MVSDYAATQLKSTFLSTTKPWHNYCPLTGRAPASSSASAGNSSVGTADWSIVLNHLTPAIPKQSITGNCHFYCCSCSLTSTTVNQIIELRPTHLMAKVVRSITVYCVRPALKNARRYQVFHTLSVDIAPLPATIITRSQHIWLQRNVASN